MADVAVRYGVTAALRQGYPGVWIDTDGPKPRKLGALGLRVEHGITYHGIALNIATRLGDFELIDPCGMAGLDVTSIARELDWEGEAAEPSTEGVYQAGIWFAEALEPRLTTAIGESSRQRDDRRSVATPAPVFIALFDADRLHDYLKLAAVLRTAGIGVEVFPEAKKLGQQLKYADRRGFRVALIAGENAWFQADSAGSKS